MAAQINESPSVLYHIKYAGEEYVKYLQTIFFLLPWIFSTHNYLFDSIFFLLWNIISWSAILAAANDVKKKTYVQYWIFIFGRLYFQYYVPIMVIPTSYRMAFILEKVIDESRSIATIFSLIICIINLITLGLGTYLSSIFLDPIDFIVYCNLDVYDGKTQILLFLTRVFDSLVLFLFNTPIDESWRIIFTVAIFFLHIFVYYFRGFTTVHVSLIGTYLELSPLFAIPFVLSFKLAKKALLWWHYLLIIIVCHIIFVIIIKISNMFVTHESVKIFSPFINSEDEAHSTQLPSFIPGNLVSVIRIITHKVGNPQVFDRFLAIGSGKKRSTAQYIEVARFLGLYPSRRVEVYQQLETLQPKSIYNQFMIHFFKKVLNGLNKSSSLEIDKHQAHIDDLQRSYIVHCHYFWKARKEQKLFRAFKESFSIAHFHIELRYEFRNLLNRFPFDSNLYSRFSDFIMTGCGDFDRAKKLNDFSHALEHGKHVIQDPLFHPMSLINPRILMYAPEEEHHRPSGDEFLIQSFMMTSSHVANEDEYSSFFTHSSDKTNPSAPIASLVSISNRSIPFFQIITWLLPIVVVLAFVFYIRPIENENIIRQDLISMFIYYTNDTFSTAISSMYLPYALNQDPNMNLSTPEECSRELTRQATLVNDFYSKLEIPHLCQYIFNYTHQIFSQMLISDLDLCKQLDNLGPIISNSINEQIVNVHSLFFTIRKRIHQVKTNLFLNHRVDFFAVILWILSFLFILIYCLMIVFQLQKPLKGEDAAISCLASRERLGFLLLEQNHEAWELLRQYIQPANMDQVTDHTFLPFDPTDEMSNAQEQKVPNLTIRRDSNSNYQPHAYDMPPTYTFDSQPHSPIPHVTPTNSTEDVWIKQIPLKNSGPLSTSYAGDSMIQGKKSRPASTRLLQPLDETTEMTDYNEENETSDMSILTQDEYGQNPIDLTAQMTMITTKYSCYNTMCLMCMPFLIANIIFTFLVLPVNFRFGDEYPMFEEVDDMIVQLNASMYIMSITFFSLISPGNYSQQFIEYSYFINQYNNSIKNLFNSPINSTFPSVQQLVIQLAGMNVDIDQKKILFFYMPCLYNFVIKIVNTYFKQSLNSLTNMPRTNDICFLVVFILILFNFVFIGYQAQKLMYKSFNSIFHFPDDYLHQGKEKEKNKNKRKQVSEFPSMILLVTTVQETDEIYSISDNAMMILNRTPEDFICKTLSSTFPLVQSNPFEIREYLLPDQRTKKNFRSKSTKIGKLIKTIMIEDFKASISNTKTQGNKEQLAIKLAHFVPLYFAKLYGDERGKIYDLNNFSIIFIRMHVDISFQLVDKFFSVINNTVQNYTSYKLVKVDGSIACFVAMKEVNAMISYLFIRDIINSCKTIVRTNPVPQVLYSILLEQIPEGKLEIKEGLEPYLDIGIDELDELESGLYQIPHGEVCISKKLINECQCNSFKKKMIFNPMRKTTKEMYTADFNLFVDTFSHI